MCILIILKSVRRTQILKYLGYFHSEDLFLIWGDLVKGEDGELEKKGPGAGDF